MHAGRKTAMKLTAYVSQALYRNQHILITDCYKGNSNCLHHAVPSPRKYPSQHENELIPIKLKLGM